mgnify:CR=1 FL=1
MEDPPELSETSEELEKKTVEIQEATQKALEEIEEPHVVKQLETPETKASNREITNLGYTFSHYAPSITDYTVHWKGDYAKIIPKDRTAYQGIAYDTVYLDIKNKRAVGYCESSACRFKAHEGVVLPYAEHELIIPLTWKDYVSSVQGEDEIYLMGVETIYKKASDLEVWGDIVYELPIKVKDDDGITYYYNYFKINSLDMDVEPVYGFEPES